MNPFEGLPDNRLMDNYVRGESAAFDVLYHRHKAKVHGFLNKRLASPADVAEVFQNVFLKFHRSRDRYDSKYHVLQWLFTIARSELLDFCKKKRIKTVPIDEEHDRAHASTESFDLGECESLSVRERKVIELRFYSELDYDEISKQLNTSQGNARKILSRGLAKIRKSISRKESP